MSDRLLHLDGGPVLPRHRLLNAVLTVLIGASAVEAHQSRAVRHSGHVDVNGSKLYYEVRGSNIASRRIPVILVHGRSLDRTSWDRQFKILSKFFTTYRYDLRGHGLSDAATGPVALHDDLIAFMDALGIDKAYLVGQSLGGNIVTEVAASHPHRVEKLVLIDSGINGFPYPTPNVLQRLPAYLDLFNTQGRDAALRAWLNDPLFSVTKQNPRAGAQLENIVLNCSCSLVFNPQFEIRPPTYSRLSQVKAPTLVMVGEFDHREFQAAADALHQQIQGSTKVVIPGAGHMANHDEPLEVTWEILEFLLK
jgi:3-oxoadipate enol-lactonase